MDGQNLQIFIDEMDKIFFNEFKKYFNEIILIISYLWCLYKYIVHQIGSMIIINYMSSPYCISSCKNLMQLVRFCQQ